MEMWAAKKVNKKAIEFCSCQDNKYRKPYDSFLIQYEINADTVYAEQLFKQKHISKEDFYRIKQGLEVLLNKNNKKNLEIKDYEDVHSLIESRLRKIIGKPADNLYLGKSRNDQSSTILRMYMKDEISKIEHELKDFIFLLKTDRENRGKLIIPGYTHNRIAMPYTYGKLLETYIEWFKRDIENIKFWIKQYNKCPLGSAAGFGSPLNLDRGELSKKLGFKEPVKSTLDAVMKCEAEEKFVHTALSIFTHLSQISSDFINYSREGVDVVKLPNQYCLGSSIMPQKHNPDVLETIKGKKSRISGFMHSIEDLNKGNFSGYNREMQTAKYSVIDTANEFDNVFDILEDFIAKTEINEKRSKELLDKSNAYSAGKIAIECANNKKSFRREKLKLEEQIKNAD